MLDLRIDTFNHFKPYSCRFFQFLFVYIPIKMFSWWIFACQWSKFVFPIFAKRLYHGFLELLPSTTNEKTKQVTWLLNCAYRNSRQWRLKVAIALRIAKTRSIGWLLGTFDGTISDLKSNWWISNFLPQSFRISRKFDHPVIMLNLSMKTKARTTQFARATGTSHSRFRLRKS